MAKNGTHMIDKTFGSPAEADPWMESKMNANRALPLILSLLSLLAVAIPAAAATTFVVNSAHDATDGLCDGTHCSLREAILEANAGFGLATIVLTGDLPEILDTVTIDTQPGGPSCVGNLLIRINGAGAMGDGLVLRASGNTVRGLVINGLPSPAPAITLTVSVDPSTSGIITNTVSVSSPTTDPNPGTNDTNVTQQTTVDPALGTITIVKDAVPDDAQDFSFSGDLGTFSLDDDDADPMLPSSMSFAVAPGFYSVSEDPVAGWLLIHALCDNGDPAFDIFVGAGETVTCTFFNAAPPTVPAGTGILFGTDASDGNLLTVGSMTGIGTVVGPMGVEQAFPSLAFDPTTGTLYAGEGAGEPNLYTVDPATGTTILVGSSGLGFASIGGMDFDSSGVLYASVNMAGNGGTGSDHLATLDTATGLAAVIGPFGTCTGVVLPAPLPPSGSCDLEGMEAIAFDESGTLWGAKSERGAAGAPGLYTIDPGTGVATFVAPIEDAFGFPASGGIVSLQFALDGTLFGGTARSLFGEGPGPQGLLKNLVFDDGGFLVTIDPATGLMRYVGGISATGGSSLGGLALGVGTIVIEKATVPAGGTGFGFTDDVPGSGGFTLDDGGSVSFKAEPGTYTVTESSLPSGWNLTAIDCVDPSGGTSTGGAAASIALALGETVTCTFTNSAVSIDIQKTPDTQTILAGGTASFTITLTNTGAAELTNVVVSDPAAPNCATTITTLSVGAPVAYGCTLAGVTADFTNTASVIADTPAGTQVSDSDSAEVIAVVAAIEVSKASLVPQVFAGNTATFTIGLRNVGLVDLTNLAVSDPLTPDCDRATGDLPALPPGGATSYTCETAPLFADLTNEATASADVPEGPPVNDSAIGVVEVVDPAIEITKTPAQQQILAGETAAFTITITNPGDTTLVGINVSDVQTPDCEAPGGVESTDPLPNLGPGQSIFWDCETEPRVADLTNVATVTAVTREGLPVDASASAFVEVIAPIEIIKSPTEQEILPGETATFTITLNNPGTVEKTNVEVTDPLTDACDITLPSLTAGGTFSYGCTTGPLAGDLTNVAKVTAETEAGTVEAESTAVVRVIDPPIAITKEPAAQVVDPGGIASFTITVSNPGTTPLTGVSVVDSQTAACTMALPDIPAGGEESYNCNTGALGAGFTNVATVTATASGVTVKASASAEVNVREPIVIVKTPAEQSVPFGAAATFTITITNEGTDEKTDVAVADPQTPDCERAAGELPALAPNGGSVTYTCTTDALSADLVNEATVTAEGSEGTVTASDSALVDVLTEILITKTPASQQLEAGTPATFTIEVTNGGDEALTDVAVADPATPACESDLGSLAPGVSVSYDCTTEPLFADLSNVATASALSSDGLVTATATAEVEVIQPLAITKEPPEQEILAGQTATFTITVSNPSAVTRTSVAVSDPLTSACDRAVGVLGDLAPGASTSYDCTTVSLFGSFTNVATATAEGPAGTVTASANALVLVLNPVIEITKTPAAQLVSPGDPASFTITVTHPGPGALTGLAVSDPLTPACDRLLGELPDLPPETSTFYDCQTGPLTADFTNLATVTATSEAGLEVNAAASAVVNVVNPIEIVKGPFEQQVVEGAKAAFTITVTNDGELEKTNVAVADPLSPDCNRALPDLAPNGGSATYTCESPPLFADLVNVATVTADSEEGPVTASASAFAEVIPSLPPVVAGVATETGPLAACDTVRSPVRRLQVAISGSEQAFVGADDPASYLLVGAGPDGDFATAACAGGAAGDDVPIEIVSLSLTGVDPVTVNAGLVLGGALDPGLYRLLVCDTITDAAGNALDGDGDMSPGGDFVLPFFRADPFNRFENGHFDDCPVTLDPWITLATAPNDVEAGVPGTDDSDGSPLSASARVAHALAEPASALAQCVAVEEGATYNLVARVRFNPLMGAVALFEKTCEFFAGAACTGASLGPVAIASVLEDEGGAWIFIASEVVAPEGAVTALCDFVVEGVGEGSDSFDVFFDGLFLGNLGLIFADGFESGDVSAWSSSVP